MLIHKIEQFLRRNDMPPTRFGRLAAHDPRFVFDLRNGREPGRPVTLRIEHFMNAFEKDRRHAA